MTLLLSEQYRRQLAWRDWKSALAACPLRPGQKVLDLGCGPGDVARLLVAAGALVTGVDGNPELLAVARAQCPEAEFLEQDLGAMRLAGEFDGLWSSFTAAYFPDFAAAFAGWRKFLKSGAWVCFVEMEGLLDHSPLPASLRERVDAFYAKSRGYDFRSGGKIQNVLAQAGFRVRELELRDAELSFQGPASAEILAAWEQRLDRMGGLKRFLGAEFPAFREEFLACLRSPEHRSECRVLCVVGT